MKRPSKKLIEDTAHKMWYWVRDRQKAACEKNGWWAKYYEHFSDMTNMGKNAWLLAAKWHLLNCNEDKIQI